MRKTTELAYDGRWQQWVQWAEKRGLDPISAPVTQIADFFLYLFNDLERTPGTIKGYRTSLASVFTKIGRGEVISDKALSDLLNYMSIKRPAVPKVLPGWDLGLVLDHLKGEAYEPLKEASLRALTLKTAFLVTLAAGARRSEIQALMFDEPYCRIQENGSKATLHFAPGFLRKNQSPFTPDAPLEIPALPTGRSEFGAILCPVRALRYYRRATADQEIRKGRKRLFVPFRSNNSSEISATSIARWVSTVIVEAHTVQKEDSRMCQALGVRAHDVRAVAASLVKLQGASLSEILQAGRWTSGGTFTKFYLRDLVPQADRIASVGPIVAGGRVISIPQSSAPVALTSAT